MKYVPPLVVIGLVMMSSATAGMSVVGTPAPSANNHPTGPMRAADTAATVSLTTSNQAQATNALRIPAGELRATKIERATISVGHAVAMDNRRIHTEFSISKFREKLADADTASEKRTILLATTEKIKARAAALQREARTARKQFNEGGSAYMYLTTLAQLHAEADALEQFTAQVQQRASQIQTDGGESDLSTVQIELQRFQGPVREAVSNAIQGETDPTRVYIATSTDAVVLATIVDGEYLREVYRASQRQPTGARTIESISEASAPVNETYPWAWSNQQSLTVSSVYSAGSYVFRLQSPQGQLEVHLDAHTGNIYREVQRIPLSPQYLAGQTSTKGDLQVTVNRSYGGGPIRVQLTERTTGSPINGSVLINGERVGTTGADGILWTLAPYRVENIQVVTLRDGEETSITI